MFGPQDSRMRTTSAGPSSPLGLPPTWWDEDRDSRIATIRWPAKITLMSWVTIACCAFTGVTEPCIGSPNWGTVTICARFRNDHGSGFTNSKLDWARRLLRLSLLACCTTLFNISNEARALSAATMRRMLLIWVWLKSTVGHPTGKQIWENSSKHCLMIARLVLVNCPEDLDIVEGLLDVSNWG